MLAPLRVSSESHPVEGKMLLETGSAKNKGVPSAPGVTLAVVLRMEWSDDVGNRKMADHGRL